MEYIIFGKFRRSFLEHVCEDYPLYSDEFFLALNKLKRQLLFY